MLWWLQVPETRGKTLEEVGGRCAHGHAPNSCGVCRTAARHTIETRALYSTRHHSALMRRTAVPPSAYELPVASLYFALVVPFFCLEYRSLATPFAVLGHILT
jgi:hypothetical protein